MNAIDVITSNRSILLDELISLSYINLRRYYSVIINVSKIRLKINIYFVLNKLMKTPFIYSKL